MKVVRAISAFFLGITIVGAGTSSAHALTLFQDNFDSEARGLGKTTLTNWNVTPGNVDVIGSGFFDLYPGNGNYLDMDGTPAANATIVTKNAFNLVAGEYRLSFKLGSNGPSSSLLVQLGAVFSETFGRTTPFTNITRSFTVTAPTIASLSFAERGTADQGGSVLDAVVLEQISATPIPTPALLPGLVGLGIAVLKRKSMSVDAEVS